MISESKVISSLLSTLHTAYQRRFFFLFSFFVFKSLCVKNFLKTNNRLSFFSFSLGLMMNNTRIVITSQHGHYRFYRTKLNSIDWTKIKQRNKLHCYHRYKYIQRNEIEIDRSMNNKCTDVLFVELNQLTCPKFCKQTETNRRNLTL